LPHHRHFSLTDCCTDGNPASRVGYNAGKINEIKLMKPQTILIILTVLLLPWAFILWFGYAFSPGGGTPQYRTPQEMAAAERIRKEEKERPDSIHVVSMPEGKEIWQSFGPGIGMSYRLMDVSGKEPAELDKLTSLRGSDLYVQPKITYDHRNDWFVFSTTETGSGDYMKRTTYARVEGDRFRVLLEFPADQSMTNADADPVDMQSMQVEVTSASRKEFVLSATYTKWILTDNGTGKLDSGKQRTLKDRAVFVYDEPGGKFVFRSSQNPTFKLVWEDKEYYPD
jgi:hypothetical protein